MFYVNNLIRLHTTALDYLALIQRANNRYEDKRQSLQEYDNAKSPFAIIRLMQTRSYILEQMDRWENLAAWLVKRYLKVKGELDKETFKRTSEPLNNNQLSIMNS